MVEPVVVELRVWVQVVQVARVFMAMASLLSIAGLSPVALVVLVVQGFGVVTQIHSMAAVEIWVAQACLDLVFQLPIMDPSLEEDLGMEAPPLRAALILGNPVAVLMAAVRVLAALVSRSLIMDL
jgi:hypothetical protein